MWGITATIRYIQGYALVPIRYIQSIYLVDILTRIEAPAMREKSGFSGHDKGQLEIVNRCLIVGREYKEFYRT